MIVARVVNARGRAFNVRLIQKGDRYGLDDCRVHEGTEPMVEFWDATYEDDPRFTLGFGQFAARYYLATLTGEDGSRPYSLSACGLSLCGHEAAWTVTGGNVADAIAAAKAAIAAVPR